MPEFPPTQLPPTVENAILETNRLAKATPVHVSPLSGTVQVTADGTEVTVVDTSQVEIVNEKPHTLSGWLDATNFAALAQTAPNATLEVRWYVDGKLYRRAVFYPTDFTDENILLFLERAAIRYHKITIITNGTGASDTNPLSFDYGFEIRAAFQPISQLF